MVCPVCHERSKVLESRPTESGSSTRRRRQCSRCEHRFTTFERYAEAVVTVRKRNGSLEPFDSEKLRAGIGRSAHKRPAAELAIDQIVLSVEDEARETGEITSRRIGEICLEGLRDVDRVAYLRFASVHKQLADIDAISAELSELAIPADFGETDLQITPTEQHDSPDLASHSSRREIHA